MRGVSTKSQALEQFFDINIDDVFDEMVPGMGYRDYGLEGFLEGGRHMEEHARAWQSAELLKM